MDRRSASLRLPALAVLLLSAATAALGCRSISQTVAYLVEGTNTPAEYEGLQGKKVAVVCRTLDGQQFRNATAAHELGQQISDLLKPRVKKIKLIDQQKVNELIDRDDFESYYKIGKELKADVVVGVELESFSVLDGQTLYRGRATCAIKVYDVAEKQVEWKKMMSQCVYPEGAGTATTDRSEPDFRAEFIRYLADQIARNFYAHDKYDDVARDAVGM